MVGILICSINKDGILTNCLNSLRTLPNYLTFRIYLCVPPSVEVDTTGLDVTFVPRAEDEEYSYSKFANRLVRACEEDYICLLNDDTEAVTPDWLTTMLVYARDPEIGIVGAKLIFPDGRIQHVGAMLNAEGICGHLYFKEEDRPDAVWNKTRYYSVVTGAVSVMRKSVYEMVGGYDERLVSFNDVDFCLKVQALGYKNIYVAEAVLIHYESVTRGLQLEYLESDQEFMRNKWGDLLANDPYKE